MEKSLSLNQIVGAYYIINNAPLYQVENKMSVIKLLRALKPHVLEFEDLRDDILEKLKPADFEERQKSLENGEKNALAQYQAEVAQAIEEPLKRQITISFEPLTEETLLQMVTKGMTNGQIMELIDIFCG